MTREQMRFIPTPVGNASGAASGSARRPVHPHARGERPLRDSRDTDTVGSSPRPWGTPLGLRDGTGGGRFIPTPLGNAG